MGLRLKKKKQMTTVDNLKIPSSSIKSSEQEAIAPSILEKVVTIKQKNDTIKEVDFFGFSPEVFTLDLKRTGWATVAVLTILVIIYFLT